MCHERIESFGVCGPGGIREGLSSRGISRMHIVDEREANGISGPCTYLKISRAFLVYFPINSLGSVILYLSGDVCLILLETIITRVASSVSGEESDILILFNKSNRSTRRKSFTYPFPVHIVLLSAARFHLVLLTSDVFLYRYIYYSCVIEFTIKVFDNL